MNTEMVVIPIFLATIAFMVWLTITAWQARQRMNLTRDFNMRLIDQIGSMKDFSDFLQSDAGAEFMKNLSGVAPSIGPADRILRAFQTGVVLLALGVGLTLVGHFMSFNSHEVFTATGIIANSLGIGLLLSSGASYRLAKTIGMHQQTVPWKR